jgi:hypothetical protein
MSKFAKGKSWIEHRLADTLSIDGAEYRAELVARKGTGVQGFRVTVVFLPLDGGADAEIDLPNAASTAEIHARVRELSEDHARLEAMYREAARP